jgi:purine-binding chemotaxis protein CheW
VAANNDLHVVGFRVGDETFGVPVRAVHEIMRVPEITAMPEAPDSIRGVVNLRGKIIPVLDLRKRFGISVVDTHKKNRVLVTEVGDKLVGMIVDEASALLKIPLSQIEQPPNLFEDGEISYVTGVGKVDNRLIVLIDLTKVILPGELKQMKRIN